MAKKTKKPIALETDINKNLYYICIFVTIVTMAMGTIEFFSRGIFFPNRMNLFYLGVLLIYTIHKELIRWLGQAKVERKGEVFVYSWVVLTTLLYVVNFLSKDFYNYMPQGGPSTSLRDMSIIALEVLALFILTRCLKIIKLGAKVKKIRS